MKDKELSSTKALAIIFFPITIVVLLINYLRGKAKFSISFRSTISYAILIGLFVFCLNTVFFLAIKAYSFYSVSQSLERVSDIINSALIEDLDSILPYKKIESIAKNFDIQINLYHNKSPVVIGIDNDIPLNGVLRSLFGGGHDFLMLSFSYPESNNQIEMYKKLDEELRRIKIICSGIALLSFVGLVIVVSNGSKDTRKMLLPIKDMLQSVNKISVYNLDKRISVNEAKDELKDLAQTFNTLLDNIEESYTKQKQFVSDASHELRTPISVIKGYSSLLHRWGKDDKVVLEESIEAIRLEALNMEALIERLLFLARNDTIANLEKTSFALDDLLAEVIRETKLLTEKHKIISLLSFDENILADRKYIKQALRIFIDNAIKFTDEGGTIEVSSFPTKGGARIHIVDSGVGIPQEDIPKVFDKFYRVDKSRTKVTGGSGLGLYIAKLIIEHHEGAIGIESTLGVGTKIKLELPTS